MKIEIVIEGNEINLKGSSEELRFDIFYKKLLRFIIDNFPVEYSTYINSVEWFKKANEAKRKAGYKCEKCGKQFKKGKKGWGLELHAHHLNYERLGRELPEDIMVLCKDCHDKERK